MAPQLCDALLSCFCGSASTAPYHLPTTGDHYYDGHSPLIITEKSPLRPGPQIFPYMHPAMTYTTIKAAQLPPSPSPPSLTPDDSSQLAQDVVLILMRARAAGPDLDARIDSLVGTSRPAVRGGARTTSSWSESLAKKILRALEQVLDPRNGDDKRASWGEALTEAYDRAVEVATDVFGDLVEYAREHPTQAEIALSILLSLFTFGVLVRLAPRVLVLLGFGAEGPLEGSFAAWFMSTYGGYIPKGSVISYLQRLGMTWGKAGRKV